MLKVYLEEMIIDGEVHSSFLLNIEDIWLGCFNWEDYENLNVANFTPLYFSSMKSDNADTQLTYLGEL